MYIWQENSPVCPVFSIFFSDSFSIVGKPRFSAQLWCNYVYVSYISSTLLLWIAGLSVGILESSILFLLNFLYGCFHYFKNIFNCNLLFFSISYLAYKLMWLLSFLGDTCYLLFNTLKI